MSEHTIENKLRQAWHQERRFVNVRGASRLLIWIVAMLVVDFLIDWGVVFRARVEGRFGVLLLVVNIAILIWVLWHEWLRHLKPFDPVLVALDVEAKHPELSSVLVSYTQLKGPMANQPNVSADLIAAMRDQAIERTEEQIEAALARAKESHDIQQRILDHAQGFDAGALSDQLELTHAHLEV